MNGGAMESTSTKAQHFLEAQGFGSSSVDAEALLEAFQREMEAGLAGRPGSLAMLPSYLPIDRPVPAGERVIVLDAGGTNLRVATVIFDGEGQAQIDDYARYPMPGTEGELDAAAYFGALARCLEPVLDRSERIGFCFSYPAEITPDGDGKLLRWTKEIRAPEVVGRLVGRGLSERLEQRGHRKRITMLNDTTATLLAGKSAGQRRRHGSYVGFILGTGTNTAYIESNRQIRKAPGLDPAGYQPINVESGNFDGCPRTAIDRAHDGATANPGQQTFEKMISGVYLGDLGRRLVDQAAAENLFSARGAALLAGAGGYTTIEVARFLKNPFGPGLLAQLDLAAPDRELAFRLLSAVVERAALLAATNIAAAILKSGAGADPLHPVCVNVDGSTFHKTHRLSTLAGIHLDRLLRPRGLHGDLIHVDEAPIVGAAVAGLTR